MAGADRSDPEGTRSKAYDVVALIPCRDGQDRIGHTVASILNQTVRTFVSIADDASTDDTAKIIEGLTKSGRVGYVQYPRREPRDYARVPVLLNMALAISPPGLFYMISGDDCTYGPKYCETLIVMMRRDGVGVCSGYVGKYNRDLEPPGSGRLLTSEFLMRVTPFPHSIGWETWTLYEAQRLGQKVSVYPVPLEHHRKYSVASTWTFGQSAYVNGVPLLFTLLRTIKNMVRGDVGLINSLSILLGQIEYSIRHPQKLSTANFVRDMKLREIREVVMGIVNGHSFPI